MKVLLAASEIHPFAKTGGLADVLAALPRALLKLGIEPLLCLPFYRKLHQRNDPLEEVADRVPCTFANGQRPFRLLKTPLPGAPEIPVYLVQNPGMFESEHDIYGVAPGSYGDAHLRFLYFSRAILKVPRAAGVTVDLFHLHDWQTALVPPLLRTVYKDDPELSRAATVLTIHNLAYQGSFPVEDLRHAGLPEFLLQEGRLLEGGLGNLLAGGIRFADGLSTVSRSYAREILTQEQGCGLEGLLAWRRPLLRGIVNGLDTRFWDPARDPRLDAPYSLEDLSGKARCKEALLRACGMPETCGPLFGIVSRLVTQKGLDLVLPVMQELLKRESDVKLVVLGSGLPALEEAFQELAQRFPRQVHVRLHFDADFASRVEAGADFFLMPSRFEPCGLNQLISMRYGTLPIVRRVGGLADTVTPLSPETRESGQATGFCFEDFKPQALAQAIQEALRLYREQPDTLRHMQENGMRADWSFEKSAREYQSLYLEAQARARTGEHLKCLLEGLPEDPLEVELPPIKELPARYDHDLLDLLPQAPATLFCQWDLSDASLAARLAAHPHAGWHLELKLADCAGGSARSLVVGQTGWKLLADCLPDHTYRASLCLVLPNQPAETLLDHAGVTLPGDVWPEDL